MTDYRKTLARIRKQADTATPGPWRHISIFEVGGFVEDSRGRELFDWAQDDAGTICASDPDAEFIAASRTTVPALLDLADAVLERHVKAQPITAAYGTQEGGDYCAACAENWPCPDYTAATIALEAVKAGWRGETDALA